MVKIKELMGILSKDTVGKAYRGFRTKIEAMVEVGEGRGAGRGGKTASIFEDHIFPMCPSLPSPLTPPPPHYPFNMRSCIQIKQR
jgi:hypothetical protein